MIIALIALIVTAPVAVLIVVAINACHRSVAANARTARGQPPAQLSVLRLAAAGSAVVTLVLADVGWVVYALHWAQIPLLTNLACGAVAVGALVLLREREPRS